MECFQFLKPAQHQRQGGEIRIFAAKSSKMGKVVPSSGEANQALSFEEFKASVLNDYRIACESREASLLGRKEVLTGKAKFGIFGDGKEIAQLAMAKAFREGDFRSGYYRDQTFMLASLS